MKDLIKATGAILISSVLTLSHGDAHEYDYYQSRCGSSYEDCHRMTYLAPAIAVGVVATVALIAVIVNNSSGSTDHFHNTFGS